MDYIDTKDLTAISIDINRYSLELRTKLLEQARCKVTLDKLLNAKMDNLVKIKKNIGIETAIVMSLDDAEFHKAYSNHENIKADCDGLKILIEALKTQIMLAQSLMRFTQKEGG